MKDDSAVCSSYTYFEVVKEKIVLEDKYTIETFINTM